MAKMQKLEETVELNCSAEQIFEMTLAKQSDIAKVCSHRVANVEAHQNDWLSVGSTRKWNYNLGGKSGYLVDRLEAIDEKNMIMTRKVIEGDLTSHYKELIIHQQAISKGKGNCSVKYTFEYEKTTEDAPEPTEFLNFALAIMKELAGHLSSAN